VPAFVAQIAKQPTLVTEFQIPMAIAVLCLNHIGFVLAFIISVRWPRAPRGAERAQNSGIGEQNSATRRSVSRGCPAQAICAQCNLGGCLAMTWAQTRTVPFECSMQVIGHFSIRAFAHLGICALSIEHWALSSWAVGRKGCALTRRGAERVAEHRRDHRRLPGVRAGKAPPARGRAPTR
jgi:hypothetical protein